MKPDEALTRLKVALANAVEALDNAADHRPDEAIDEETGGRYCHGCTVLVLIQGLELEIDDYLEARSEPEPEPREMTAEVLNSVFTVDPANTSGAAFEAYMKPLHDAYAVHEQLNREIVESAFDRAFKQKPQPLVIAKWQRDLLLKQFPELAGDIVGVDTELSHQIDQQIARLQRELKLVNDASASPHATPFVRDVMETQRSRIVRDLQRLRSGDVDGLAG